MLTVHMQKICVKSSIMQGGQKMWLAGEPRKTFRPPPTPGYNQLHEKLLKFDDQVWLTMFVT